MRRVFAHLDAASGSDATVLLLGETGTGKELAAEAIHDRSKRSDRPFVVVDCGSLPSEMIQSELFGHVRGAFTGATQDRLGAFQAADGGTIFLDEVGEMPQEMQPNLLRVLESRMVSRIGETARTPVDVRVIAATHRDLHRAVNERRFRSDLYYRLAVFPVRLPPLRDRLEDLPGLVDHLCSTLRLAGGIRERLLEREHLDSISQHDWPGNVRELRNHLELVAIRGVDEPSGTPIGQGPPPIEASSSYRVVKDQWVGYMEQTYLRELHESCDGNVADMAKRSGLSRTQIYRMLEKHGLR